MIERLADTEPYKVPLAALVEAYDLWNEGYDGPITVVDTTAKPPVISKLFRLASGGITSIRPFEPVSTN
jgi:hypothetical protein